MLNIRGTAKKRIAVYLALSAALVVTGLLTDSSVWQGNRTLHTMMEVMATLLASIIGILALVRFYSKKSSVILFIGVGFMGTALLDGYHAVVTSDLLDYLMPSPSESLIPWSWNASRTFLSILMTISCLQWWYEQERGSGSVRVNEIHVFGMVGAMTLACFCFFAFVPLPRAYYPEFFFGRPEEFVAAAFFLAALTGYALQGRWQTESFEHWLLMSLIVGFLSQAMIMSRSFTLFDGMFDLAHTLKIVSYCFVLIGLLASMLALFHQAEQSANSLTAVNDQLQREIIVRKRGEANLQEANRSLAVSNAELEQFAYVASHDLQEPMRKIASCCQILQSDYADKLDDDGKEWVGFAVSSATRMRNLIRDLLAFSRVGKADIATETIDAKAICLNAIDNLQSLIDETDAKVVTGALPEIKANRTQLGQLFQNLIGNGLKYRSDPPPRIEIGCERKGELWEFFVKDNGIGIEAQYADRIFAIFQRLHNKDEYTGTGIGLAICKKIVDQAGGRIWVESVLGQGTTFYFTWPQLSTKAQT